MTRIEEIAGKLTKAGRGALLTARPIRSSPDQLFVTSLRGVPSGELDAMTFIVVGGLMLNDYGLAVRDHLMKEQGE